MDSLKLDRFRRLLNRQYTSINLADTSSAQPAPSTNSLPTTTAIATTTPTNTKTTVTANLPLYVTKDNPKPAIFLARKLFSDFVELVDKKIEPILAQEQPKHKPIFRTLQCGEDVIYDQILQGLGVISEFCLPSLLRLLLAWYQHQLGVAPIEELSSNSASVKRPQSALENLNLNMQQQALEFQNNQQQTPTDCGSPCGLSELNSLSDATLTTNTSSKVVRSSTPSSPDTTSNQLSITSSLSLDYGSPASLTTIIQSSSVITPNNNNSTISGPPPDTQQSSSNANTSTSTATNISSSSLDEPNINIPRRSDTITARNILVEFAFCQALIEMFSKLHLHPGHDDLIGQIEDIAFNHFKPIENQNLNGVDANDVHKLVDKYAEIIGVLAKARFRAVKRRFFAELNELRSKDPTLANIQAINILLTSMKYFRVKMAPIEEFEASFQFLQECADYFVELRHKSIKHSLAELFVEIMLPLASTVKNEVKIPCLKNFVDTLWSQTLDMCNRKKHSITLFPLVTCLLCVSQRTIFLQNWGSFLTMCLSNLKNRDQKMCRVALESLYRLVWVYMIRVKCESNNVTQGRLNSIVEALFPKGSRQVVPRDTPLFIYVDIIQFIAQERLDFAMRNIIFDLLSVDRQIKIITAPERMNIGLQAFLAIADNLQQKESEPMMPVHLNMDPRRHILANNLASSSATPYHSNYKNQTYNCDTGPPASGGGNGLLRRTPQSSHHKMLNDETAKSIGLHQYHNSVQKSFNDILRALDAQYGRPLMLTVGQNINKDPEDLITSDMRAKVELFKTCIGAIPRLMPDGLSKAELIDLLSRMTVHVDEHMRRYAFDSLQILVTNYQDWRLDAIEGFTLFLANQIDESMRGLTDNALKMLLQFLLSWRGLITSSCSPSGANSARSSVVTIQTGCETISSRNSGTGGQIAARKNRALAEMRLIQGELSNTPFDRLVNVIQKVEGASLVMLCSYHHQTRKYATQLLRECRSILKCYSSWTCMEQFGLRSPDDVDEDELSASIRGSLSADNLSRITATSATGPAHSSVTSMNTQPMLTTSVSRVCLSAAAAAANGQQQTGAGQANQQHDLYDEDDENNLLDGYSMEDNSTLIFWVAIMLLESDREREYTFALRLLKKILPNLPFEQPDFLDELERNLGLMQWDNFPGLHSLILKGCASSSTYDLCINLLDHLTPILKHRICTPSTTEPEHCLPSHILVLSTHLLSTYEDPTPFSLNIARRLAMCCEENSQKLENLSAVMTLYSRRSFSKDAFQWIKCVAKYLHDAYAQVLPSALPLLIEMLESGPEQVQRLIAPILYCILSYIDTNNQPSASFNGDLVRIYNKSLDSQVLWRDALQLFKLIVSKSSHLANGTTGINMNNNNNNNNGANIGAQGAISMIKSASGSNYGRELPGRTMEFSLEIECLPVIARPPPANNDSGAPTNVAAGAAISPGGPTSANTTGSIGTTSGAATTTTATSAVSALAGAPASVAAMAAPGQGVVGQQQQQQQVDEIQQQPQMAAS